MNEELHKSYGFALKQWDALKAENARLRKYLELITHFWYDGDEVLKLSTQALNEEEPSDELL